MDFLTSLQNSLPKEEITKLIEALDSEPLHCVLLNPSKISQEEFLSLCPNVKKHPFIDGAYLYNKEEYDLGKSLLYDVGAISIQDASSMMVPYFLDPKPGDIVLDFCAAPGGKTAAMSFAMNGQGIILANDLSFPRAKSLSQNVERLGLGNVIVNSSDFAFCYQYFEARFDKILLDAPCSGSAMFRKNELAKQDWSMAKVKRNAEVQKELLEYAYFMLKEGGTICYSTCSFSYEENEGVILPFLEKHVDMKAIPARVESKLFYHHPALIEGVHFYPHLFPGEGQFVVLLQKDGELLPTPKDVSPTKESKKYIHILREYGLESRYNFIARAKMYSLPTRFHLDHLNTLRAGVKLFEIRDIYFPEHAFARFLSAEHSIELTKEEAKKYLSGEVISLSGKDGFAVLSYQNRNLGWAKLVQGKAKNHYPKGLRHLYKSL